MVSSWDFVQMKIIRQQMSDLGQKRRFWSKVNNSESTWPIMLKFGKNLSCFSYMKMYLFHCDTMINMQIRVKIVCFGKKCHCGTMTNM